MVSKGVGIDWKEKVQHNGKIEDDYALQFFFFFSFQDLKNIFFIFTSCILIQCQLPYLTLNNWNRGMTRDSFQNKLTGIIPRLSFRFNQTLANLDKLLLLCLKYYQHATLFSRNKTFSHVKIKLINFLTLHIVNCNFLLAFRLGKG